MSPMPALNDGWNLKRTGSPIKRVVIPEERHASERFLKNKKVRENHISFIYKTISIYVLLNRIPAIALHLPENICERSAFFYVRQIRCPGCFIGLLNRDVFRSAVVRVRYFKRMFGIKKGHCFPFFTLQFSRLANLI